MLSLISAYPIAQPQLSRSGHFKPSIDLSWEYRFGQPNQKGLQSFNHKISY